MDKETNLIRIFTDERQHSADILHALNLGAEGSLGVEVALDEVAVLAGSELATAVDPDAAGPGSDLALDMVWATLKRKPLLKKNLLYRFKLLNFQLALVSATTARYLLPKRRCNF